MSNAYVFMYRSTDTGAPRLSGTAGDLTTLLTNCLISGYNSQTAASITRSGTTATVSFGSAHNFASDGLTVVNISGANQSDYNGNFQITNVTANTFDFTVANSPVTPATGTITVKVAPAGWTSVYTGTNKLMLRSSAVDATQRILRVDDNNPDANNALSATWRGYETASDVDTGTGLFPTAAQAAAFRMWKSDAASTSSREWILIADDRFIYFFNKRTSSASVFRCIVFGDFVSHLSSDAYGCLCAASDSAGATSSYGLDCCATVFLATRAGRVFIARDRTQTGASYQTNLVCPNFAGLQQTQNPFGRFSTFLNYPLTSGDIYYAKAFVDENTANQPIRGELPGLLVSTAGANLTTKQTYTVNGSTYFNLKYGSSTVSETAGFEGAILIKLFEAWR